MSQIAFLRDIAAGMEDGDIKKAMVWAELELGERAECILELEDEIKQGIAAEEALREALCKAKAMLEGVCQLMRAAAFQMPPPAIDMAPWKNINAHWERTGQVEPTKPRSKKKVPA